MRVAHIKISQILGVDELEITPGSLTVLSGANGVGKTSVLEALKSVLGGGHDHTLLRNGAEVGEVVLVLDDGTEIRKRVTEKGSTLSVKDPIRGSLGKPQGFVGELVDSLSSNPVTFLTASPKERARYLLEAMPLRVTAEEVAEAVGKAGELAPEVAGELDGHALDVLAGLHKRLYDERTGVNRAAKEKAATVAQLSEGIPAEVEEPGDAAALRQQRVDLTGKLSAELREIEQEREAELARIREHAQKEIERIKAEAELEANECRAEAERKVAVAEFEASPELDRLTAEIARAEEREKQAAQIANTRRVAEQLSGEVEQLEARSAAFTAALAGLEALKGRLLERLPMKGIEIRDGEIYREGVPFDRLNRSQQVQIALKVATLRAGDLPLICVDGLECLDEDTFKTFCERAAKTDLQLVVTRVTEGDFSVETMGAREVAHA